MLRRSFGPYYSAGVGFVWIKKEKIRRGKKESENYSSQLGGNYISFFCFWVKQTTNSNLTFWLYGGCFIYKFSIV